MDDYGNNYTYIAADNTTLFCTPFTNMSSFYDIYSCYGYFASRALLLTILEIGLGVSSVLANGFVFWIILQNSSNDNNRSRVIFDKILLAHAIVDFVTAGLDLPFYHILTIFGYWPFDKTWCIIWSTLDNAVNMISILHVFFLSLVQLMSILKPQKFSEYFLVKYSSIVPTVIWISGLTLWVS